MEIIELLVSVITSIAAIIALVLTVKQIRLSNKQSLFDKRLECYLKIDGLMKLYEQSRSSLEQERNDEPIFAVEVEFLGLINNSYLEEIGETIKKPLEEPGHKKFLIKREELKKLGAEADLIFKGEEKTDISLFVLAYEQLLFKMYEYQIYVKSLIEYSERFTATHGYTQNEVNEISYRKRLLEAYAELNTVYSRVIKTKGMEKLKKQIQL